MNQNARKTAKTKVEKDFYKLLNNSNFGNDCRNNIGNCKLELIFDGYEEIAYIKKYSNIFKDPKLKEFFPTDILREQVNREFEKKMEKYDETDPFHDFLIDDLEQKREEDLEAISGLESKKRKRIYVNAKKIDSIEKKLANVMT